MPKANIKSAGTVNVPRSNNSLIAFNPAQRAANNAELLFRNMTSIILADLEVNQLENGVTYGLLNTRIWDPASQSYQPFTDQELRIEARDFDTAKAIFWPRFRHFVYRKTGKRIPTEIQRIYRLHELNAVNRGPDQVLAAARADKLTRKELESAQAPVKA